MTTEPSFAADTADLMASLTVRMFTPEQIAAMAEGDVYAEVVADLGFDPADPPKE